MGGIPFIVSAPSGAGKTTLCKKAVDYFPDLRHSISYTTRLPRAGEVNGVDYWFIEDRVFDEMIARGEFLEYAGVYGKRYGTSKKDLDHLLSEGLSVILEIDIQGADQIREKIPGAVGVFILPPSIEACRVRLRQRGKDSTEEIEKRLNIALEEVKRAPLYDYIIINDDLEAAFERFKSVVAAEKARTPRMLEAVSGIFGAATEK